MINLTLNDLSVPAYDVRMKIYIKSSSVIISTKDNWLPPPITLQGGFTNQLSGADLMQYLDPANLEFQGITQTQFQQTGLLPEGVYQFSVEVYDYNVNTLVSNSGNTAAWLILNDPPLLNLPLNQDKPTATDPQNLVFQWTPRHTGSPNSAFSTEHEFELFEIWPSGADPNNAALSSPPIYTAITSANTLVYGPAEPPLVPGREYAWRVQARDVLNRDLFKNNGYSEVFMFKFGDECILPTNISAQAINAERVKITWTPEFVHTGFQIDYRLQSPGASWATTTSLTNYVNINNLSPGEIYEFRVMGQCGTVLGSGSPIDTVSTPSVSPTAFACQPLNPNLDLINQNLIQQLNPGDVIHAADFDVEIISSSDTTGGAFNGFGRMAIPMLDNINLYAQLVNAKINTDLVLIDGKVELLGVENPIPEDIRDDINDMLDDIEDGLDDIGDHLDNIDNLGSLIVDQYLKSPYIPDTLKDNIRDALDNLIDAIENGDQGLIDAAVEQLQELIDQAQEILDNLATFLSDLKAIVTQSINDMRGDSEYEKDSLEMSADSLSIILQDSLYNFNEQELIQSTTYDNVNVLHYQNDDIISHDIDDPNLPPPVLFIMDKYKKIMDLKRRYRFLTFLVENADMFLTPGYLDNLVAEIKQDIETVAVHLINMIAEGTDTEDVITYVKQYLLSKIEDSYVE